MTDSWSNVTPSIASYLDRKLHLSPSHPISLTRELITSRFPETKFTHYTDFPAVVSTGENFDLLGFPIDHPGRSRTDTYYVNRETVLRTHTSAHEVEAFRATQTPGYTISADVYRRDAVDRSHYPVFHQMEGALTWDRSQLGDAGGLAQAVLDDVAKLPKHNIIIEEDAPAFHPQRNPIQAGHTADEVVALATHLKRSLEDVVVTIFSAVSAATPGVPTPAEEPLRLRWIEGYFPFTSPSWELEVYWRGEWLELLGCGISQQHVLNRAGQPHKSGWAFGIGIERVAMLLFGIPDIRLFWSTDPRFTSQFKRGETLRRFVPFSKHPPCYKDVSFWLPNAPRVEPAGARSAGGMCEGPVLVPGEAKAVFHENDMMELVREIAGDVAEDVTLTDDFTHPRSKRRSLFYRINYRSLTETLTNERANEFHERVQRALVEKLGVEIR